MRKVLGRSVLGLMTVSALGLGTSALAVPEAPAVGLEANAKVDARLKTVLKELLRKERLKAARLQRPGEKPLLWAGP